MSINDIGVYRSQTSVIATNTVLRNTYLLLALTLIFSGITAGIAMVTNASFLNPFITMAGYFGLLMVTYAMRNSPWGILAIFALTGFMGYTLGPILNFYLTNISNGNELIMTALGGTGLIFFALSGYVLVTRKDMSFLGGFIFAGCIVGLIMAVVSMFLQLPIFQLAVAGVFMLLSSCIILFRTSQIIHGGETNYIMATIDLYVSLYNIFLSLLQILGAFNDRD